MTTTATGDGQPAGISRDELGLATRNHGMPLEALRHDLTPAGLHYVLVHYDIPDGTTGSLTVDGAVRQPLQLSVEELEEEWPTRTEAVTLECAGNGRARLAPRPISQPWLFEAVGTAAWTGVPVTEVLDRAGLHDDAVEVVFTGRDRGVEGGVAQAYQRSLTLEDARRAEVILAHHMNGEPLPAQHGAPLRLVVPGWYGMASVKWLERITVVTEPFAGYQQARAYVLRRDEEDPGRPVTRIQPRSLMQPPGVPDFLTRRRFLAPGSVTLAGRAWSGFGPVTRVEVSVDGGAGWQDAELGPTLGTHGWRSWRLDWEATPGHHVLCSRATDETGRTQSLDIDWNTGGYEVNAIQRIDLEVGVEHGTPPG